MVMMTVKQLLPILKRTLYSEKDMDSFNAEYF